MSKLTAEDIESKIVDETYTHVPNSTMTICVLTLANGFYVSGESACIDPNEFKVDTGMRLARAEAVRKVWDLEAYLACELIHTGKLTCKSTKEPDFNTQGADSTKLNDTDSESGINVITINSIDDLFDLLNSN